LEQLEPKSCFAHYDYALLRRRTYDQEGQVAKAADYVLSMPTGAGPQTATEFINGNVKQIDLLQCPADIWSATPAATSFEFILRAAADQLGIKHSGLRIAATKLLIAYGDDGQQALHWDNLLGPDTAGERYSCLLYLSDNKRSTSMPRYQPRSHFPSGAEPSAAAAAYLEDEWYHSASVQLGDLMIFKQTVPHYGVANVGAQPRIALFAVLSSSTEPNQDGYQLFRWVYLEMAFGEDSAEFADALVRDAHVGEPLARYHLAVDFKRIVRLLLVHGRYENYPWEKLSPEQQRWAKQGKTQWEKEDRVQAPPKKKTRKQS
jgi:hypothetical protein